jgi:hypothetical protein
MPSTMRKGHVANWDNDLLLESPDRSFDSGRGKKQSSFSAESMPSK